MLAGKRVAVVVPARDEARHLADVLDELPPWVDDTVVVDDGSTDATSAIARARAPSVRLVRHPAPRGPGAAVVSGYRAAMIDGAEAVAVVAGDGQMRADELGRLVEPVARGGLDYCKGDRTAHPELARRMPRWRRLGNAVLTLLTRRLTGYASLRDAQSGYTVARTATLADLPLEAVTPGYGYPNELLGLLADRDARIGQRTVTPVYGDETSGLGPWRAVRTLVPVLLRMQRRRRRAPSRPHPALPAGATGPSAEPDG